MISGIIECHKFWAENRQSEQGDREIEWASERHSVIAHKFFPPPPPSINYRNAFELYKSETHYSNDDVCLFVFVVGVVAVVAGRVIFPRRDETRHTHEKKQKTKTKKKLKKNTNEKPHINIIKKTSEYWISQEKHEKFVQCERASSLLSDLAA